MLVVLSYTELDPFLTTALEDQVLNQLYCTYTIGIPKDTFLQVSMLFQQIQVQLQKYTIVIQHLYCHCNWYS